MRLEVTVTQEHIDAARCFVGTPGVGRCKFCPIALAIGDLGYPDSSAGNRIAWLYENEEKGHLMPEEARRFVVDFDTGREVSPFTGFAQEIPSQRQ